MDSATLAVQKKKRILRAHILIRWADGTLELEARPSPSRWKKKKNKEGKEKKSNCNRTLATKLQAGSMKN